AVAMRVGSIAAEQERRRSYGAGRHDKRRRVHGDLARRRIGTARVQADTMNSRRASVAMLDRPGACAREECRASRERRWNGRHQHRLLGVRRTTHPAIAEIPAALDVALYLAAGNTEHTGAPAQRAVVFIRRYHPGCDAE